MKQHHSSRAVRALRACVALCAMQAGAGSRAAEMLVAVELPRLKHRPYVAVWLEREDRQRVAELALWHEGGRTRKEGKRHKRDKYLPDLRHWWRTGGSALEVPVDGVSGPTRPAGVHRLQFGASRAPLDNLPAGRYRLVVEAAREDGGDEMLSFAAQWPPRTAQQMRKQGGTELGEVVLELRP